jgi:cytochrome c peroxidase
MSLANARFYRSGRFFWDERAATLEAQVLAPVQDATEMGLTLEQLVTKLRAASYYPALFQEAFGTPEITSDRVARALAQFVRSLVSGGSTFDRAFAADGPPNFAAVFTAQELQGQQLFNGQAGCARCHATNAHASDGVHNTGLDAVLTDAGAGQGRFKAPSLRNVAVRAPYMHDGRFRTLEEVVAFYDGGVRENPFLDPRLRGPNGRPQRLGLSPAQQAAIVAYLRTLTDTAFLADPRFADPFAR